MVCTSQPLATQVGLDILKAGGSAVAAANAALGLTEPVSCGVGGDLFAVVWVAKTHRLCGLNASGHSPLGLRYEQARDGLAKLRRPTIPSFGLLPIGVPGAVDGWESLHVTCDRLPLAQVLAPAIRYAKEGFPVSELIASHWEGNVAILGAHHLPGAFLETFAPDGQAPAKGGIFCNPGLARTYEFIAAQGSTGFYRGEIADRINAFMRANGGWVYLESGVPWNTVAELKRQGHDIRVDLGGCGGYQTILWDAKNRVYYGASESRMDGQAAGY